MSDAVSQELEIDLGSLIIAESQSALIPVSRVAREGMKIRMDQEGWTYLVVGEVLKQRSLGPSLII